jgi:hypothetical protein
LYFLFLSSISHPGNSSQLLFLGRPGNPFPALSFHVIFRRSWDGPQRVCTDSPNLLLISHHFHVYTSCKRAVLHPVENTFILRLSCLHMFTKLNSNRDVTIFFESISWALFLHKFVAEMFFFRITSFGQNLYEVPQYEKLKKPCISRFLLITNGGKNFIFKIFSNFSRVLFVLNIQSLTKWNRLLRVV